MQRKDINAVSSLEELLQMMVCQVVQARLLTRLARRCFRICATFLLPRIFIFISFTFFALFSHSFFIFLCMFHSRFSSRQNLQVGSFKISGVWWGQLERGKMFGLSGETGIDSILHEEREMLRRKGGVEKDRNKSPLLARPRLPVQVTGSKLTAASSLLLQLTLTYTLCPFFFIITCIRINQNQRIGSHARPLMLIDA